MAATAPTLTWLKHYCHPSVRCDLSEMTPIRLNRLQPCRRLVAASSRQGRIVVELLWDEAKANALMRALPSCGVSFRPSPLRRPLSVSIDPTPCNLLMAE
jgi:hypothetical protein